MVITSIYYKYNKYKTRQKIGRPQTLERWTRKLTWNYQCSLEEDERELMAQSELAQLGIRPVCADLWTGHARKFKQAKA